MKRPFSMVGMRSFDEIKADPMATVAEITALSNRFPGDGLRHPNCPAHIWWPLAATGMYWALLSPAGPLFILEDPARWERLELDEAESHIRWHLKQMKGRAQRLFAADCAEHVLHFFTEICPANTRLQEAIAMARTYAAGRCSKQALMQASNRVYEARAKVQGYLLAMRAADAVRFAAGESNISAAKDASEIAADVIGEHASSNAPKSNYGQRDVMRIEGKKRELRWQWHRLLDYLRGNP